jgi:hypothetical protein
MKKIVLSLCFLGYGFSSFACDICGCGVGSYYLGILPEFRKKFIGLRYQQRGLMTHMEHNGTASLLTEKETFRITELWGASNIGNKLRILGFIPLNSIQRSGQATHITKTGLGDAALIGYYKLLDHKKAAGTKLIAQSVWIGGGIKLPTGKYDNREKNIADGLQNTFQLGTGSLDFTLNAVYDFRVQDFGINTNISYKINTANKYEYRYGDKLVLNVLTYYKFRVGEKVSVGPNAGLMFETAGKDRQSKEAEISASGGHALMGTAGLEVSWNRLNAGANLQTPLPQHTGAGGILVKNRGMVYLSFSL